MYLMSECSSGVIPYNTSSLYSMNTDCINMGILLQIISIVILSIELLHAPILVAVAYANFHFLTDVPMDSLPMRKHGPRLSKYQLSELMKRFQSDPYIKGQDKELIAKNLGLSKRRLAKWFERQRFLRLKQNKNNSN